MAKQKPKKRAPKPTARGRAGRPLKTHIATKYAQWFSSERQPAARHAGTNPLPPQTPAAPRAAVQPQLLPTQQAEVRKSALRKDPSPVKPLEVEGWRTCDGRGSKTLLTPDQEPRVAAVGNRIISMELCSRKT